MKSNFFINVAMPLLVMLIILLAAIFIDKYSNVFDSLGLMAKKRLLDNPMLFFAVTPIAFWISAYLCRRYSPNSAGNNLTLALMELQKNPNDFSKVSPFLNHPLVFIKAASSLIASFGGGALGKEGPSAHMFAALFATFSNKYKKFLPKISLESWVFAGSAAGLAIVFNAPIAGLAFIVEKLSKVKFENFNKRIFLTLITILSIAIIFYRVDPIFYVHPFNFDISLEVLLGLVSTAVICGIVAVIFKKIIQNLYIKILNIKSTWWHLIPIVAGLLSAFISFHAGIYSFGGGIETIKISLLEAEAVLSYQEVVGRILNTALTFISGCAGGLIAPAMTIGASIGSVLGAFVDNAEIGIFLLVGMAAFLGVILGEFITAAVIVFEVTKLDIKIIPFLLASVIISALIAKITSKVAYKTNLF
jgi:H+/Cl- antiporter ClcA